MRWPIEVAPDERPVLGALLVLAALKGAAIVFLETPAETLFIVQIGTERLPFVYIGIAVVASLIGIWLTRTGETLGRSRLVLGIWGLLVAVVLLFWVLLVTLGSTKVVFALMIWREVSFTLSTLAFWTLAGSLLDVRQGKRLFGAINAAEVSALVAGGLSVPFFARVLGTQGLLLLSAGALLGAFFVLVWILKNHPPHAAQDATDLAITRRRSRKRIRGTPYLRLFFILSVLTVVGYYLVDFVFYDRVQAAIPDERRLATFFGTFFAAYGVLQIATSLFLVGPILTRYGVGVALLALPLADAFGITGMVIGAVAGAGTLLLIGAVGTKLLDEVTRKTLNAPAERILYQAIPGSIRFGILALRESVVEPLSIGLAGVLLLVLTVGLGGSTGTVLVVLGVIVAAWIVVAHMLRKEYPRVLSRALSSHRILPTALEWKDPSTLNVVRASLDSPVAGEVIYGLEVLERLDEEEAAPSLRESLTHSDSTVRRYALERLEALGDAEAMERVESLLEEEPDPDVLASGVRCLAALRGATSGRVLELVRHPRPQVQDAALVGLLRSGGLRALAVARALVRRMAGTMESEERVRAAQIIGEGGGPLQEILDPLLRDHSASVRAAAAEAAWVGEMRYLHRLILALRDPSVREGASASLIRLGEPAVEPLRELLADEEAPPAARRRAARILGHLGLAGAEVLHEHLEEPHEEVRDEVLASLARSDATASSVRGLDVNESVRQEVETARWTVGALRDLQAAGTSDLVVRALRYEVEKHLRRVLDFLSLTRGRSEILEVRTGLASRSSERRTQALELLETLLPRELAHRVLPLAEGRWHAFTRRPDASRSRGRLNDLITGTGPLQSSWLRVASCYEAGRRPDPSHVEPIRQLLDSPSAVVREAACWALIRLDPDGAAGIIAPFGEDPSPRVRRVVEGHLERAEEEPAKDRPAGRPPEKTSPEEGMEDMPQTVERVIILKTVSIFREIPEEYLVELADSIEEVETTPGDPILRKGDEGSDLYVIVRGKVRVHDGDRFIAELGTREVFGELAALDPEVRSASVTAEEEGLLYRVSRRMLYDLMAERSEVARGIISVLCRRIRRTIGAEGEPSGSGAPSPRSA